MRKLFVKEVSTALKKERKIVDCGMDEADKKDTKNSH